MNHPITRIRILPSSGRTQVLLTLFGAGIFLRHVAVRAVALLAFAVALAAADSVALANSEAFEAELAAVQAQKPSGDDQRGLHEWLWKLSHVYMRLRRYEDMEVVSKAMVAIAPTYFTNHSNLSVAYGKQGKYALAIEEARIAALLNPGDSMHAELVMCSWLYLSGKKSEALERFSRILVPTESSKRGTYFACKASLYASVGDVAVIKEAIRQTLKESGDHLSFFERDISFDSYRDQDWFIELVGKTLAEKAKLLPIPASKP